MQRICVFCGSREGNAALYREAAARLGSLLAARDIGLVYGGGRIGLMGVVADAALSGGAEVIGVIPDFLSGEEIAHHGLTELRVVGTMHERKALMAELADGFIALPGGYGTLEEFFEILTWAQLGLHCKPCSLLDVDGYYQPLLRAMEHAFTAGFVHPRHRGLILHAADPESLLEQMAAYSAPQLESILHGDQI